jgi:ATP-binding cassette subfamily B protein
VDAIGADDTDRLTVGLVLFGVTIVVSRGGDTAAWILRQGMNERTELVVDTELAELTAGIAGIEHFERTDLLDDLELLRIDHQNLSQLPDQIAAGAAVAIRLVITLGVLVSVDARLALLPVFALPSIVATWRSRRRDRDAWEASMPAWRLQGALFFMTRSDAAGREARVFGLRADLLGRFRALNDAIDGNLARAYARSALEDAGGRALFGVAYVVALFLIAQRAVSGDTTPGDVALVLVLSADLNAQVSAVASVLSALPKALHTAARLLWLRDFAAESRARSTATTRPCPPRIEEGIRLHDVGFAYPGTDRMTLEHVDLHLPAGATVAIVGENGAGKTTLVKLLTRMYEPTTGRITIEGVDLADISVDSWRQCLSAGFQDFVRFELSAQHAVGAGWLPDLDDTGAARAALMNAGGDDVLDGLADGLGTQLGRAFDDGVELSGGQWQKLALGRAMMRTDPLLVILDEPTAALDPGTEAALFTRYAENARERSARTGAVTVLISHRFSTVRMADHIIVLSHGRVAEVGSHDELMRLDGVYAELYQLQARSYR